jgi:hypothetical protein
MRVWGWFIDGWWFVFIWCGCGESVGWLRLRVGWWLELFTEGWVVVVVSGGIAVEGLDMNGGLECWCVFIMLHWWEHICEKLCVFGIFN